MHVTHFTIQDYLNVLPKVRPTLPLLLLLGLLFTFSGAAAGPKSTLHFVHSDHLGTPQRLTNENGVVVWSRDLDPYGQVLSEVGPGPIGRSFPGQYPDSETGLNYNHFRDYDPAIGRYLESDPIGLLAGSSTYSYVGNNPIRYFDPLGLIEWEGRVQQAGIMYYGVGLVKLSFELTSECVRGQRVTIQVEAKGPMTGLGGKLNFGWIDGPIAFEDFADGEIIPGLFDGTFNFMSFSAAAGAGATVAKIRLGRALQIRSYIPLPVTGVDVSMTWSGGGSDVRVTGSEPCDCALE